MAIHGTKKREEKRLQVSDTIFSESTLRSDNKHTIKIMKVKIMTDEGVSRILNIYSHKNRIGKKKKEEAYPL